MKKSANLDSQTTKIYSTMKAIPTTKLTSSQITKLNTSKIYSFMRIGVLMTEELMMKKKIQIFKSPM